MKKQDIFGDILPKLELKSNLLIEFELTSSFEGKKELDEALTLTETIQNEIKHSIYMHSTAYPLFLMLTYKIDSSGITKAKLESNSDEMVKGFLDLYFEILDKTIERKHQAELNFYKMNQLIANELDEDDAKLVDTLLISSAFADYHLLNDFKQIVLKSNSAFTMELLASFEKLKDNLGNAIQNFDRKLEDLVGGDFRSTRNSDLKTGFRMTEEMAKSLLLPVDIVNKINQEIFEQGITKQHVIEFLNILDQVDRYQDYSYIFRGLNSVFKEPNGISLRKKKLILHDIFKIYDHPRAKTDKQEDQYLGGSDKASLDSLAVLKCRVIEQLIPDLK